MLGKALGELPRTPVRVHLITSRRMETRVRTTHRIETCTGTTHRTETRACTTCRTETRARTTRRICHSDLGPPLLAGGSVLGGGWKRARLG